MAARGSASKEVITSKILETFPNSFVYGKEIRIPIEENGETIQIKVTLTAAKTNVECGGDTILPGEASAKVEKPVATATVSPSSDKQTPTEPTEEEKENLQKLISSIF